MAQVAVIWRSPFDQCLALDLLPGTTESWVWDCTRDGQTLVGWCQPGPHSGASERRPCKWNKTTLAVTELTAVAGVTPGGEAIYISPDGSIIVTQDYNNSTQPYVRFTSGGAAGSRLTPAGGAFTTVTLGISLPIASASTGVQRFLGLVSDDNTTIVGRSDAPIGSPISTQATRWVGTTPTLLPLATGVTSNASSYAESTSADAQRSVGHYQATTPNADEAVFWQGTAGPRVLYPPHGVPWARGYAFVINAAGTAIWGGTHQVDPEGSGGENCYWDSLGTVNNVGGTDYYGVSHIIVGRPPSTGRNDTTIQSIAVDATTAIFCGTDNYSPYRALKWTNSITPTDLGVLPTAPSGSAWSNAFGISGDGSIVVGTGNGGPLSPANQWGLWWDASLGIHLLPTLPGAVDFSYGTYGAATGISRDGSTIFGWVDVSFLEAPPEPVAVTLAMDDVVVTSAVSVLQTNQISLRFSDDRGHSWGNPVLQDIGEIGQYRTSLQWTRLGMARDRCFEISWSVPMLGSLQGSWVDVTPAQS